MNKRLLILAAIITAIFAGVLFNSNNKNSTAVTTASTSSVTATPHVTGKTDAAVTLTEYSDFQCPACGAYYPIVEQVIQKYHSQIRFEYRHYPLVAIHQNAFAAARAAEAAGKQGKFWEMYRELFKNQAVWENASNARAIFDGYAERIGLNLTTFRTDFASSAVNDAINASIAEFNQRGLPTATPTFLLNGKPIEPRDANEFGKLIDEQLQRSRP